MKYALIFIIFILLSWLQFLPVNAAVRVDAMTAKQGVMDLRYYDFTTNGPVSLNGQWSFYWGRLLTPKQLQSDKYHASIIGVPNGWNGQISSGRKLPSYGVGTYELQLLLPPSALGKLMALNLTEVTSAYRLWENGQYLGNSGIVGTSSQTEAPKEGNNIVTFPVNQQHITICIQISNFHQSKGGIWSPITFGYQSQIEGSNNLRMVGVFFAVGALLLLGLYHFVIFLYNREDKASLFLSMTTFTIAIRTLIVGNEYIYLIFPNAPWELIKKIQYLSVTVSALYFTRYMYRLFPKETTKIFESIVRAGMTVLSVLVLILPASIFTNWLDFVQMAVLLVYGLIIVISILAYIHRQPDAGLNMFGVSIYGVAIFNDVFYFNDTAITMPIAQWGFLGYLFIQSILLAKRLGNAYRTADQLSKELAVINESLEDKIKVRTKQLTVAMNELSRIEKDRSHLLHDIAHEIGTPLTKIQGYIKAILDGIISNESPKYLHLVYDKAEFIGHMLQDLYQLTDLQSHQLSFHKQLLNVDTWLKKIFEKNQSDMKNHTLNCVRQEKSMFNVADVVYINVDPLRLEQVMSNLLSNAVKYSPVDQEIAIGWKYIHHINDQPAKVEIFVTNQGPEISDEERERIFQRFYRSKKMRTEVAGAGLGLAICKEIIQQLNGEISVKSDESGNTFTVLLPAVILSFSLEEYR